MRLKSLELTGFKSFSKKTVLIFDSAVTAVVGPNGSGKSNVAEAFRWVLGEQSLKSLRGKRGEDLIWNGSQGAPRAIRASVTVTFDNRDKKFNVAYDEVKIERVVHRDGLNDYLLNGTAVRLKDILELLAGASLGSSGHHIIRQGEADRVLESSAAERRELLEDAFGLRLYQWKIAESEKKLEKTEDNLKQVASLRRELAPHLKYLEREMEKIKRAESLRVELKEFYEIYLATEKAYLAQGAFALESELRRPKGELHEVETKLNHLSREEVKVDERALDEKRRAREIISRDLGRIEGLIEARRMPMALPRATEAITKSRVEDLFERLEIWLTEAERSKIVEVWQEIGGRIKRALKEFWHPPASGAAPTEDRTAEIKDLENEQEKLEKERAELETEISTLLERAKTVNEAEKEVFALRLRKNELMSELATLKMKEERLALEKNHFTTMLAEAKNLLGGILGEGKIEDINDRAAQEVARREIEKRKLRLEDLGVESGDTVKEYKETVARDEHLAKEITDLEASGASLRQIIEELQIRIDREFREGLAKTNQEFQKFFALMFGGGTAELILTKPPRAKRDDLELTAEIPSLNSETPSAKEEGVDINLSLPRKKIRGLEMLSGGERSLTAISLLFALSQVNPPPFMILDETDAALDEANSRKYGDLVEQLAQHSQLILITHNRETMSRASVLYGVTMGGDGASRLLSIKLDDAMGYAK